MKQIGFSENLTLPIPRTNGQTIEFKTGFAYEVEDEFYYFLLSKYPTIALNLNWSVMSIIVALAIYEMFPYPASGFYPGG